MCNEKVKREFRKEIVGADSVFNPDDIADYENDAWDIRISIGDAPLEEAFYYTIDDSKAVDSTIEKLLEDYALNPANASKLDVSGYPDLPFIQAELNLYFENARKDILDVDLYVNHAPESGPVDIRQKARDYLSVCTYHDGSHDYRVLDLVLVATPPELGRFKAGDVLRKYGHIYLMLLLDYKQRQGDAVFNAFLNEQAVKDYLKNKYDSKYKNFISDMRSLDVRRDIKTASKYSGGEDEPAIQLTEEGRGKVEKYKKACLDVAEQYDCYDSCAIAPPALGVPGGFDVRVQMIEFDGKDIGESVLLRVLEDFGEEYFCGNWADTYEDFSYYNNVHDALAYKTNFSVEILTELKKLAEDSR